MAEDQVPRKLAYEQAHPGVTIRMPQGRLLYEARGEFGGEEFQLKTATLKRLLDVLEALEKADVSAWRCDRVMGERGT
jgi:hypothetical protein